MLDRKLLRNNYDEINEKLKTKKFNLSETDFIYADEMVRSNQHEHDSILADIKEYLSSPELSFFKSDIFNNFENSSGITKARISSVKTIKNAIKSKLKAKSRAFLLLIFSFPKIEKETKNPKVIAHKI